VTPDPGAASSTNAVLVKIQMAAAFDAWKRITSRASLLSARPSEYREIPLALE